MKCNESRNLVVPYLDSELDAKASQEIQLHLQSCAECAEVFAREERFNARLFRVLRAGHYWVPMWYRDTSWVAHWDAFSRPDRQPKLSTGAPGTWWWDEAKAKTIGL